MDFVPGARQPLVEGKGRDRLRAIHRLPPQTVRIDNWERLRRVNFGRRALVRPVSEEALAPEVSRYDAAEAGEVARRFRAVADLDRVAADLVTLYREVIDEQARLSPPDPGDEPRAAAAYLRHVSPKPILDAMHLRTQHAETEARRWQERAGALEAELGRRAWRWPFLSRVRPNGAEPVSPPAPPGR